MSKILHWLGNRCSHSVCCNVATGIKSGSFESHASRAHRDHDGHRHETPRWMPSAERLASLDLFLNDFKITLGGEGNVFLKSPRYVSGSTRNGEFVDNQKGFTGVVSGFPAPAFLNRGRFLIGAPVPSVILFYK